MAIYKLEVMYRDASNYKTHFKVNVNSEEHPEVANLKDGDDIIMGEYGTPLPEQFFNNEIHLYSYDDKDDHNFLEVNKVVLLD